VARDLADGGALRAIKEIVPGPLPPAERAWLTAGFEAEAALLSQLRHPTLAAIYDAFTDEADRHYLVLEFVPGVSLEEALLNAGAPLPWRQVAQWGVTLCEALRFLHTQDPPVVHRDLKPANVLLTPEGALKLIDFGVARRLAPSRRRDTALLGTDGYAALEQYAGQSQPRSDLYALGATLYHLVTGAPPESAPSRALGDELRPPSVINPTLPKSLDATLLRALALEAQERFATADAFKAALNACLEGRETVVDAASARVEQDGQDEAEPAPRATTDRDRSDRRRPRTRRAPQRGAGRSRLGERSATALRARLAVTPLRVDLGEAHVGREMTFTLTISNAGPAGAPALEGVVEPVAPHADVHLPKTQFAISSPAFGPLAPGDSVSVQITLQPGAGSRSASVAVRARGGEQQIVPLRFLLVA
jgi:serine/threonine protein kinase